jgi:peptidoglycan/LPS O-acetylase OafA/YrhL
MPFAERLRGAFSLRRNLRALFVPPAGHLRPLDGLRALSILWVVLFHAGWYAAFHIPPAMYGALLVTPWMLPAWRGDFGVDVFFVLSGFLIAGMLVDEQRKEGRIRLGLFYARRLLRLWPALVVAVLADVIVVGDHPEMAWANLFYVSNFVPIAEVAMGWTWSLAIEEQFYLVCPWLVRWLSESTPRGRVIVLALLALGLCAVAAWVVVAGGYRAFDSEIVINRDLRRWALGFDNLYTKPWMRAGPLLAGVAAAYLYRAPRIMEALGRARVGSAVGLGIAVAVAAACTHWPFVAGGPRALEYGLLLSLSTHPAGRFLAGVLSARVLYPFSQLAYSAYLLNPIVTNLVDHALAPIVWLGKAEPMGLFLPFDVGFTFLAAAVMHVLVERPFMELRPRAPRV